MGRHGPQDQPESHGDVRRPGLQVSHSTRVTWRCTPTRTAGQSLNPSHMEMYADQDCRSVTQPKSHGDVRRPGLQVSHSTQVTWRCTPTRTAGQSLNPSHMEMYADQDCRSVTQPESHGDVRRPGLQVSHSTRVTWRCTPTRTAGQSLNPSHMEMYADQDCRSVTQPESHGDVRRPGLQVSHSTRVTWRCTPTRTAGQSLNPSHMEVYADQDCRSVTQPKSHGDVRRPGLQVSHSTRVIWRCTPTRTAGQSLNPSHMEMYADQDCRSVTQDTA